MQEPIIPLRKSKNNCEKRDELELATLFQEYESEQMGVHILWIERQYHFLLSLLKGFQPKEARETQLLD